MIPALLTMTALAHDVSPGLFVPSTAPGASEIEVRAGSTARAFGSIGQAGTRAVATVRLKRVALGGTGWVDAIESHGATGWAGLALVDSDTVRLQVFGIAGSALGGGASFVAKTRRGGIGDHGFQFDLAWAPLLDTENLTDGSWSGPWDRIRSMPEGGIDMALHPKGTQFLRVGFIGPMPVVRYRIDTRHSGRRSGFVLESSLGTNFVGGVATLSLGWNGAGL